MTNEMAEKRRPLKVDLHVHSSADPVDNLPLDMAATIELAAAHGYDAIALTHHEAHITADRAAAEASERTGVLVLPGIEASLDDGAHVLVINSGREIEDVRSLAELARFKREEHLVIPAHPYYPGFGLGHRKLERWAQTFDALELCHFWNRWVGWPNRRAAEFCRAHDLPLVATGDVHLPGQIDRSYALVDASRDPRAIVDAVRAGRFESVTEPVSIVEMVTLLGTITLRNQIAGSRFWSRLPRIFRDVYVPRRHSEPQTMAQ